MNLFRCSLIALAAALAAAGAADAGPGPGHGSGRSGMGHGKGLGGRPSYHGKYHSHWKHYTWSSRYGCYTYWSPRAGCYYYWCQPASCYYPVDYCPYGKYAFGKPECYAPPSVPQIPPPAELTASATATATATAVAGGGGAPVLPPARMPPGGP